MPDPSLLKTPEWLYLPSDGPVWGRHSPASPGPPCLAVYHPVISPCLPHNSQHWASAPATIIHQGVTPKPTLALYHLFLSGKCPSSFKTYLQRHLLRRVFPKSSLLPGALYHSLCQSTCLLVVQRSEGFLSYLFSPPDQETVKGGQDQIWFY